MIRISQIKLPITHTKEDLEDAIMKQLKIRDGSSKLNRKEKNTSHINDNKTGKGSINSYKIVKKSIDARKDDVKYIYTIDVSLNAHLPGKFRSFGKYDDNSSEYNTASDDNTLSAFEESFVKKLNNPRISIAEIKKYHFVDHGNKKMNHKPVITGAGPAGLFCAYLLALNGYTPIIIERGEDVDTRQKSVDHFFENDILNPESNVQFGEGGAGTFSDGKLNTMVKDKTGRNHFVLETFVRFGADEKNLYMNKPHIGTDVLSVVVKNMRNECIRLGATFLFNTKLTDFEINNGHISCIHTENTKTGDKKSFLCDVMVLAIGHSSRDTFQMLYDNHIFMEPKAFAMGVRIEHLRDMIDTSQYGDFRHLLPAADYKLATQTDGGRGVYSFCMCPGGYVVNSSSEEGYTCVNGMSYSGRNGSNSNSAIIVTVTPDDFYDNTPLGGLRLQRELEKAAYQAGKGHIPVQMFGDFKNNILSDSLGDIIPQTKGKITLSNLRNIFPTFISESLIKGIDAFSGKIKNYNRYDAVLSGVESRTSSPLKIPRNESFESNILGIYPCGEGAGYAGGITSAGMDGIRIAEAIGSKYAPLTD